LQFFPDNNFAEFRSLGSTRTRPLRALLLKKLMENFVNVQNNMENGYKSTVAVHGKMLQLMAFLVNDAKPNLT
jgi:hypothetical protein